MHTDPPQHPLLEWMGRGQGEEFLNTGVVFNVFQAPGQTDRQEVLFLKLEKGVHLTVFEVAPRHGKILIPCPEGGSGVSKDPWRHLLLSDISLLPWRRRGRRVGGKETWAGALYTKSFGMRGEAEAAVEEEEEDPRVLLVKRAMMRSIRH